MAYELKASSCDPLKQIVWETQNGIKISVG